MKKEINNLTITTILIWIIIITSLFLYTSGIINIPFYQLPQAKGSIVVVEENYKGHNLVAIMDNVYAIPHGIPLSHPLRMKQHGAFKALSKEEAKRMIDANKEDIEPILTISETNFNGFNIYKLNDKFFVVRGMHEVHHFPLPTKFPYKERYAGKSLEDAKMFILNLKPSEY